MARNGFLGSETEQNLMVAFTGESQARNRYTYYSSEARKKGYIQIAQVFEETANNEKEHGKIYLKFLEGENVHITGEFLSGLSDTEFNLEKAIEGEHNEWSNLYPHFGDVANSEGFPDIAEKFYRIAMIEKFHQERFTKLLKDLRDGKLYKSDSEQDWFCLNCGYSMKGKEAPKKCPACDHPQGYFELLCKNY